MNTLQLRETTTTRPRKPRRADPAHNGVERALLIIVFVLMVGVGAAILAASVSLF